MSPSSKAALRQFEQKFVKEFGDHSLSRLGRDEREVVSTGSLLLDQKLGVGGLVVGRCYEAWGPPSVGKTTMACVMAAEQQKRFDDKMIGWLNVEHTFDEKWAQAHGVDIDRVWLTEPTTAEHVSDQVRRLLESGLCSMVVVDSIGAMIGEKELEKDAGESTVGVVAKIVTRMIRMACGVAAANGSTLLAINQVRANIGGYGAETAPGGGFALQHGTTAQMHFKATGETVLSVGSGADRRIVGKTINIVVAKNKVAPPMTSTMITLKNQPTDEYGPIGIDLGSEAFQLGEKLGLIERSGAWYTLADGTRHNGGDDTKTHLRSHPELIAKIRERSLAMVAHTVIPSELEEG